MKTEKGKFYGNASNKLCRKREGKEGKAGSRQNMKQRKGRKEINNTWDVWRGEGIIDTKGMDNGGKNDSPRFSRESKSKSKLKSRNRWMEEWERGLARSADLASSWETGEVSRKPAVSNQNHQEVCKFNYFPRVLRNFQIANINYSFNAVLIIEIAPRIANIDALVWRETE